MMANQNILPALDINAVPSKQLLVDLGCQVKTVRVICEAGLTWRMIAMLRQDLLQRVCDDDPLVEFLMELAVNAAIVDRDERQGKVRTQLWEYFQCVDDPAGKIMGLIDSLAYLTRERTDQLRAQHERSAAIRYIRIKRLGKELFRHIVHRFVRVF